MSSLQAWNKVHFCGVLSAALGLTRYLEITTTETGFRYREAKQLSFEVCQRLVYRYEGQDIDGHPVDYSSTDDDISEPIGDIKKLSRPFDLILVDAHHTYECASRDLRGALDVLAPGGAIVVHDCFPRSEVVASPSYHHGEWCGVTYKAYVDLVLANPNINYITLDADYGCGVILKPRSAMRRAKNYMRALNQRPLRAKWESLGADYSRTFNFLQDNSVALLRLGGFDFIRRAVSSY